MSTRQTEVVHRDALGQTPQPAPTLPASGKSKADRAEDLFILLVLLGIMAASLYASFNHMHDWTMRLMPPGTPDWFGWVNAIISELVPLVSTLKLRKLLHDGGQLLKSYALYVLLASVLLSLSAQLSAVSSHASVTAKFLACLPAVAVLVLSKMVIGGMDATRKAAQSEAERDQKAAEEADRNARQLRAAQQETRAARAELQEIRERSEAELQEIRVHAKVETGRAQQAIDALAQVENQAARSAARVEIEAGKQQEILDQAREEIQRLQNALGDAATAREDALRHAAEQTQTAGAAQGRLAEAREIAERAVAAKIAAEQSAQDHSRQVSTAAEQAEHVLRQQLAAATSAAAAAERSVAELSERVRTVQAQREEARTAADRAGTRAAVAEQQIADLERGRDAAFDELEKVRRQLARAVEKAEIVTARQPEISGRRQPEISGRPARKPGLPVLARLPENLPIVESVRPEKVAAALVARVTYPDATLTQLAEITEISDRTIGKVVRAVPADVAGDIVDQILALAAGGPVLALTDGLAA